MKEFSGYSNIIEEVSSRNFILYRGINKVDHSPVLIKLFHNYYREEQLLKLRKEFHLLQKRTIKGTLWPLSLHIDSGQIAIIFEDHNLSLLSGTLAEGPLDLGRFLKIAINLSEILQRLHSQGHLHKDLRPSNILVNQKTGEVEIIGLFIQQFLNRYGSASLLNSDNEAFVYTSPEQTGRTDQAIDTRSDLYSLGVIFYEMLTGKVPFPSHNPLVRIHSHIARQPDNIQTHNPDLPSILNEIIQKLLIKSADDRYQSAMGLHNDLKRCLRDLSKINKIHSFTLGKSDRLKQFRMPRKLYGAENNLTKLEEAFNRVCAGSVELVKVCGKAGVGKTSLIKELQKLVHKKEGLFARGKSEKEQKDTPYRVLIEAVYILISQILAQPENEIALWRERFLNSIGRNGQIVFDFLPEMEIIIGGQPPAPELDAEAAQNRVDHVFQKLIHTFTFEGNPLVLFLDSFHWADTASIRVIQSFLSDLNSRHVLIILGYREDLVLQPHTLEVAFEEIKKSGTSIQKLVVEPLDYHNIKSLIEEALGSHQNYGTLAQLLLEKTDGNPFFVKQLLQALYEKGLIYTDEENQLWKWDIDTIGQAEFSDDVVELMVGKINSLPDETIEILKIASCIGTWFDINLLATMADKSEKEVLKILEKPISSGLIISEKKPGSNYLDTDNIFSGLNPDGDYRFLHSRVSQATYSMISGIERKTIHLKLGRLILERTPEHQVDQQAYKIVNHLNQSIMLITDPDDRQQLAGLNLLAGNKAKQAAAYDSAWKYFALGTDLLTEESWVKDYEITKELYLGRSEAEYFSGNINTVEPIFSLLLKNVKTIREQVEVINSKLNLNIANNQLKQAVGIGVEALRTLFREKIPPNDAEVSIVSQVMMQEMHNMLDQTVIENLIFMEQLKDENRELIIQIMANIIPAAYLIRRNLWILLTLKMVETSVSLGNSTFSSIGYLNYAIILCSGLEDYNSGYSMGRLALNLNEKYQNKKLTSMLNFLFGSYICHWKDDAHEGIKYLNRAFSEGLEHGDFLSAANSVNFLIKTHILVGSPLEEVQREIKKHRDFIDQFNSPDLTNVIRISKFVLSLQQEGKEVIPHDAKSAESQSILEELEKSKNKMPLQWYYLVNAILAFHNQKFPEALELIQESDKLIAGYSQLSMSEHYYYYSLIITINYPNFSVDEKKKFWDILKNNHAKLKKFADHCAVNFNDKYKLVSAQMAAISGNFIEAIDLFDESVSASIKGGFIHNEAIANELAARYFLSRGKKTIAQAYLRDACYAYNKWGAFAKLNQLHSRSSGLLSQTSLTVDPSYQDTTRDFRQQDVESQTFEVKNTLRLLRNLSQEISLEKLIANLVSVFLETSAAQKAVFLLEKDSQMTILAEASTADQKGPEPCSCPMRNYDKIAKNVIYYVIRTRKYVVLDDAEKQGMFTFDPYIVKQKPKSILCIPIDLKGRTMGIIYLENYLTVFAFLQERIDFLLLLRDQVAILIKNSFQYEHMAKMIDEMKSTKLDLENKIVQLEQDLTKHP